MIVKLTEAERVALATFRRNPKYFLRRNHNSSIKRAWKVMDKDINPVSYMNDEIVQTLVKGKYIDLVPRNKFNDMDYGVVTKSPFGGC
jgi:hypothetical protein